MFFKFFVEEAKIRLDAYIEKLLGPIHLEATGPLKFVLPNQQLERTITTTDAFCSLNNCPYAVSATSVQKQWTINTKTCCIGVEKGDCNQ